MLLTEKQITYIKARNKKNREILKYDPKENWLMFRIENNILTLLLDIHKAENE